MAKFSKEISALLVSLQQCCSQTSWKAWRMVLQASTMGWVSRLVALVLKSRLTTSRESTLTMSFSTHIFLAIERPSFKAHSLAKRQLVVPIFLVKPCTHDPRESLRRPPPLAKLEEDRTEASMLSLCHLGFGLLQETGKLLLWLLELVPWVRKQNFAAFAMQSLITGAAACFR